MSPKHFFLMTSLPYCCIPGLAEIKTYAQKVQDAQVTKSLTYWRFLNSKEANDQVSVYFTSTKWGHFILEVWITFFFNINRVVLINLGRFYLCAF